MSGQGSEFGRIMWCDLTTEHAAQLRDFYSAVTGWESSAVDMEGYSDYSMIPPSESATNDNAAVAGICHARGENQGLPPVWLIYITVQDLDESVRQCTRLGGTVLQGPRDLGSGVCAVIQDPAGAYAALFEPKPQTDRERPA